MSVKPSDVTLLVSLIEIAVRAKAQIDAIRAEKPEVYDQVAKHHADALARAEAALDDAPDGG